MTKCMYRLMYVFCKDSSILQMQTKKYTLREVNAHGKMASPALVTLAIYI